MKSLLLSSLAALAIVAPAFATPSPLSDSWVGQLSPPKPTSPPGVVLIYPVVGISVSTLPWPYSQLFCAWPACDPPPRSR